MHPLWQKVHVTCALWAIFINSGCEVHACSTALRPTMTHIPTFFHASTSFSSQTLNATLESATAQHMPQMLDASLTKYSMPPTTFAHHFRLYMKSYIALNAYLTVSNNLPLPIATHLLFCSLSMHFMPSVIMNPQHQQDRESRSRQKLATAQCTRQSTSHPRKRRCRRSTNASSSRHSRSLQPLLHWHPSSSSSNPCSAK